MIETGLLNINKDSLEEFRDEKVKLHLSWNKEKIKIMIMKLTDTVEMMNSADYKERFKAELSVKNQIYWLDKYVRQVG